MPTGDRVRLSRLPGGQQMATALRPDARHPGSGSQFLQFSVAGDLYVLPVAALRAARTTLDMGMFDVSYLARAGLADRASSTLPVVATLGRTAAAPRVPGLVLAGGHGTDRTARLAKAQAWRLGRALGGAASLPGIQRLALAPPPAGVAPPPTESGTAFGHLGAFVAVGDIRPGHPAGEHAAAGRAWPGQCSRCAARLPHLRLPGLPPGRQSRPAHRPVG